MIRLLVKSLLVLLSVSLKEYPQLQSFDFFISEQPRKNINWYFNTVTTVFEFILIIGLKPRIRNSKFQNCALHNSLDYQPFIFHFMCLANFNIVFRKINLKTKKIYQMQVCLKNQIYRQYQNQQKHQKNDLVCQKNLNQLTNKFLIILRNGMKLFQKYQEKIFFYQNKHIFLIQYSYYYYIFFIFKYTFISNNYLLVYLK
ncbi:transmembrane protein, putative (macronuclear) [Tetrahymena thermophila SB210]|uniref:Transmembrane protein, putative n=1 Tax=Tetrahymena thermophila (strain SB210) TaxID=312017 RepID=W7XLE3_TETTS|nr:transmembrane protein, putative [Tetrahymena thermophila SB210]EWS76139.1 transmembrane protein, putative [Tetrahymena thermophila SB210]|eukprot:XP_012651325.1 transmembrane protein, putative [Tetrahymena thermophila SB210]